MVSLGCPKALVDSERILTRLRAEGYAISPDYKGADAVIVNTCGFLDSAKAESLEAIGEALRENGKVLVTGCLGAEPEYITGAHPKVLAVTGPHQYEAVLDAVHKAVPPAPDPFLDLMPATGVKLTPRHYSYLKISEGCNHACKFCIIPDMRGKLASRPAHAVLREAEKLVDAGVRELLVISQDTSAYGVDRKHDLSPWKGGEVRAHITDLARELGSLGAWVRLHYVYPYPHVRQLVPLMAEGLVLPYLDVPFQHAHPEVLKRMKRPASGERNLERVLGWRRAVPALTIRSTFIAGFPGETEGQFDELLGFLKEAELDRVGCFAYSPVEGAAANALDGALPDEVRHDRRRRLMQQQQRISRRRLKRRVGTVQRVLLDAVGPQGAIGRSMADAPEIDGVVHVAPHPSLKVGTFVDVAIEASDAHDLHGAVAGASPA
jgi:ribosomal protein S12 methylthiotransferase